MKASVLITCTSHWADDASLLLPDVGIRGHTTGNPCAGTAGKIHLNPIPHVLGSWHAGYVQYPQSPNLARALRIYKDIIPFHLIQYSTRCLLTVRIDSKTR